MPKEKVVGTDLYDVSVGWSPSKSVQIGVGSGGEHSLLWLLLGIGAAYEADQTNTRLEALGKFTREIVDKNAAVGPDAEGKARSALPDHQVGHDLLNALDEFAFKSIYQVFAHLDRHGCNELIRKLRKARDSAYGKDA